MDAATALKYLHAPVRLEVISDRFLESRVRKMSSSLRHVSSRGLYEGLR